MATPECLGYMAKAVEHFHAVGGSMHALLWFLAGRGGGSYLSFDLSVHLAQGDVWVDSVVWLVPGSDYQGIEDRPVPPRGVSGVPRHSSGPTTGPPHIESRRGSGGTYVHRTCLALPSAQGLRAR